MYVIIDDIVYEYEDGFTIYQFCFLKNIFLPCFCYHEKLSIAGNCRICLVEANGNLVVSCALPIIENMVIFTNSKRVIHAREGVLEFLLINHPLDCPICDQGGECDLQDISLVFGSDRGRFYEPKKKAVSDLFCCGPLIKTVMTRCIHCTRCVRFLNEVAGVFDLGLLGRGFFMEVGTFVENHFDHELSGNIVDLCPVGALTFMPYAYTARPWELSTIESIDLMDAIASTVRFSILDNKVVRILPSLDEDINEEWLTNKARFIYDSFLVQRYYYPRIRIFSKLVICSWLNAIAYFYKFLLSKSFINLQAICGSFIDLTSAYGLKCYLNSFGCSNFNYQYNITLSFDFRFSFLLNTTIVTLEEVSLCFFWGCNLRMEAPLLNARLRKAYLRNDNFLMAFSIGLSLDYLSFPVINLSNNLKNFKKIIEGRFSYLVLFLLKDFVSLKLLNYKFILYDKFSVFLGDSIISRFDANFFIEAFKFFSDHYSNRLYLHNLEHLHVVSNYLGRISCFELGLLPGVNSSYLFKPFSGSTFLYLLGTDNLSFFNFHTDPFVVFQGSFEDVNFSYASIVFPVSIYVERFSVFLNLEGRLRKAERVISPVNFLYTDLEVIRILYFYKKHFIDFNFSVLTNFYSLVLIFTYLINYSCFFFIQNSSSFIDRYTSLECKASIYKLFCFSNNSKTYKLFNGIFSGIMYNYYASDFFSRNSKILSLCSLKSLKNSFSNIK